ncbi:hypothetical protein [Actinoplanes sp. NPDC049599]|uniref:hypothetical protein n=1 Tax=Actinoplanes sp. NPDC049599 TaxID=3363903 RepID=UPI0037B9DA11
MITRTTHRPARGGPYTRTGVLRGLVAGVTVSVCGLAVVAGPASAKHCQRCDDKYGHPSGGAVSDNRETGGIVGAPAWGTLENTMAASDVTRGQLDLAALGSAAGDGARSTWVRKTI